MALHSLLAMIIQVGEHQTGIGVTLEVTCADLPRGCLRACVPQGLQSSWRFPKLNHNGCGCLQVPNHGHGSKKANGNTSGTTQLQATKAILLAIGYLHGHLAALVISCALGGDLE